MELHNRAQALNDTPIPCCRMNNHSDFKTWCKVTSNDSTNNFRGDDGAYMIGGDVGDDKSWENTNED